MTAPKPQQSPARDAYTGLRGIATKAQNEARAAQREITYWRMLADERQDLIDRVTALHQPDDIGHACTCGVTWPCKTARVLGGQE